MSKVHFISFSGSIDQADPSLENRQKRLHSTAEKFGNIDESIAWQRPQILDTPFYSQNKSILDEPRGAGFWSWKPYIILQTLKNVNKGDWVIYCDVGKQFRRGDMSRAGNINIGNTITTPVDSIIEYADGQNGFTPGVWVPHYGLAHVWTKRDCFVGMGCDTAKYHQSPHVQAGYSAWSNSKSSIQFLTEWLSWCTNEAIISDNSNIYGKPNLPGFRDHRHDQSILSNLTTKKGVSLFGPKQQSLPGSRNFNFILRHMSLAQRYTKQRTQFQSLFSGVNAEIPPGMEEYLSLQFLADIQHGDSVLIESKMNILKWQKALPGSTIDLFSITDDELLKHSSLNTNQYAGIFLTNTSDIYLNIQSLGLLYSSLKPGGCLVLGSYTPSTENTVYTQSFGQLINWIDTNQRLPLNCGERRDQRQNALTLGNAINPLQITSQNGKKSHVVLVKPKTYLGEELE